VSLQLSPSRLVSSSYIFYFQPESLLAITSSRARAHALIHRYHSLNTRPSVPPRHSAGTWIRTCDLSRFEARIGAVDRFHLAVRPWERRPSALVITLDVDARQPRREARQHWHATTATATATATSKARVEPQRRRLIPDGELPSRCRSSRSSGHQRRRTRRDERHGATRERRRVPDCACG